MNFPRPSWILAAASLLHIGAGLWRLPKDPYFRNATSRSERARAGISPMAGRAIDDYLTLCQRTDTDVVLVVWRDKIVGEYHSNRYQGQPINVTGSTIAITGLLACLLQADGKLSFAAPVSRYIPSWREDPLKSKVTVDDLLKMTSGILHPYDMDDVVGDFTLVDYDKYVVDRIAPEAPPGSRWFYANYAVQLLSPILEKACGSPLQDFARRRLFEPLGFGSDSGLSADSKGEAILFGAASFRSIELARLGDTVLHRGIWQGHKVLPASILATLSAASSANPGFGRLWEVQPNHRRVAMAGLPNRRYGILINECYVYPGADLVVVRQQSAPAGRGTQYASGAPNALNRLAKLLETGRRD